MRLVVQSVLMAAVVLSAACHPSDAPLAPPTEASIVGGYDLTIVNGGPLPYPVAGDATRVLDLVAGRITLNADHTFTDALTYRLVYSAGNPPPTDQIVTDSGTFVLNGRNIALTYVAGTDTAAITGNLLSKGNAGLLLTYRK